MRYGVIATVGWRTEALHVTAHSLAAQTSRPLDALLLFYDGAGPTSVIVEHALGSVADEVVVQTSATCSGGAWERIRRAAALFGDVGDLFVFDDDMVYPPDYVEHLAALSGKPLGLGGIALNGGSHSYRSRAPDRLPALELQLGTSVIPLAGLAALAETSVVREMLGAGGWATEAVLGWWWWAHHVDAWIVPGPVVRPAPVILPHGGATDPRSLYKSSGMNRRNDTWKRLSALTGWPACVLLVHDRATPGASS